MDNILAVLLKSVARVGAPILKGIITGATGPLVGTLAGTVIDAITEKVGGDITAVSDSDLDAAVAAAEAETPELIRAWTESQRLAQELQLAEMNKESFWVWAWRPFWMWLLAFLWSYAIVFQPIISIFLPLSLSPIDTSVLMALTGAYLALYMGGHTVKSIWTRTQ